MLMTIRKTFKQLENLFLHIFKAIKLSPLIQVILPKIRIIIIIMLKKTIFCSNAHTNTNTIIPFYHSLKIHLILVNNLWLFMEIYKILPKEMMMRIIKIPNNNKNYYKISQIHGPIMLFQITAIKTNINSHCFMSYLNNQYQ